MNSTTRRILLRPYGLLALTIGAALSMACTDADPVATDDATPLSLTALVASNQSVETADVFGQGPDGEVVASDGATLRRTPNGISVSVSMPTPEPGSYTYPTSGEAFSGPGHPEAFSLWVFVFDDPEDPDWTGAFLGGGHPVGGPTLTLSGHITTRTEPFLGDPLANPQGARVHLAVAPHGALEPELLPAQIQTPTGPGPDIWWLALFD